MRGLEIYDSSPQILLQIMLKNCRWWIFNFKIDQWEMSIYSDLTNQRKRFQPMRRLYFCFKIDTLQFFDDFIPLKNCRWSISKSNIRQKFELQSYSWNMQPFFLSTEIEGIMITFVYCFISPMSRRPTVR